MVQWLQRLKLRRGETKMGVWSSGVIRWIDGRHVYSVFNGGFGLKGEDEQ